jgi:branched-chain amino acid transport system substrate-binding protein
VQEAVEQDQVFALLPVTSQGFFAEDYLNEQHVPYFGFGFQPGYCGYDHPFAFGNTLTVCPPDALPGHAISTPGQYLALAEAIGKEDLSGLKAVAVYEDTPSSKAGIEIVNRQIEDAAAELVGTVSNIPGPPSPPVTDFTSYVNDVMSKSPDVVVLVTGPENQLGMTGGLKAAGFEGTIAGYNFSDSRIFGAPNVVDTLDGTYQINVGIGHSVFGGATFDQIRADLDGAGFAELPLSGGVLIGYSAADMFLDALAKVPEPLTAESFVNTINAGYHYPGLGNAVCESYWPMSHYGGPFCYSIGKIDKSKTDFTPAADLQSYPFALVES